MWFASLVLVVLVGSAGTRPERLVPGASHVSVAVGQEQGAAVTSPTPTRDPAASHLPKVECWKTNSSPEGPAQQPAGFLYLPFEGPFDVDRWTAQMDHDQPMYGKNGVISTLGEHMRLDTHRPGLAGGTMALTSDGRSSRWFSATTPLDTVLKSTDTRGKRYTILSYQSPSYETYFYYDGHDGHDFGFGGRKDVEILAAASGRVVFAGDSKSLLGRVVEIYHANGYLTRYAHLEEH